jgi:RNA polymerase sigma-70 factor (ECF subfamily)
LLLEHPITRLTRRLYQAPAWGRYHGRVNERGGAFPQTRHSVIERLRSPESETRREAFGDLVQGYWKPVYKYLRLQWRESHDDAQELTQSFFSDAYQKEWLARFEPDKAKFRTFVRLCADRFVMNARQSASRLKRGGDAPRISLDFLSAEEELARRGLAAPPDAEAFFRQEFVRTLFQRAIAEVRMEFEAAGRPIPLKLFERYDLDPVDNVSYAALAREFDLTPAQVTNYLAQVRRSFRERALDNLRTLCGSDEEFRREARELFGLHVE